MKTAIQVVGPTGAGKSALALEIAKRFNGEIISADSVQVYCGFDIGSAKLPLAERCGIRHHVIDIIADSTQFNAAQFLQLTFSAAETISAHGQLPVICGGTALYLRVMLRGIFPEEASSATLRQQLKMRAQTEGLAVLWRELQAIDRIYAEKIGPHDAVRIIRALEIAYTHGEPPTRVFGRTRSPFQAYRFIRIGLNLERQELYARIDARVEGMIAAGLCDEVRRLQAIYPPHCPAFRAVGYKEMVAYLAGQADWQTTVALIKQHSRNYAKRQLTWFRREPDIVWFGPAQIADVLAHVEDLLCNVPS